MRKEKIELQKQMKAEDGGMNAVLPVQQVVHSGKEDEAIHIEGR